MLAPSNAETNAVYRQLSERLQRAVNGACPAWLADRKDDLVQVALMRVIHLERESEGKRHFTSSYLWKVAHSALVDEIRRLRRRQEVPLETEEGGAPTPQGDRPSPEQKATARQIGVEIRECLAQLVEPRRRAVTLYLLGHTVPETSGILEWSLKRTENLVYRGLADLRRCLSSKGLAP